jgi:hypothetical protein
MRGGGGLRLAIATLHADPLWLPKILLHGLLGLSLIGAPLAAGWVMESMDNSRKGYPTPLPPWSDWTARYLIGIFVLLIDFSFFLLPLMVLGMLTLCLSVGLIGSGLINSALLSPAISLIIGLAGLCAAGSFASGVAPIGRLRYAEEGRIEQALGLDTLRPALRAPGRAIFLAARLRSLPAYLPFLALGGGTFLLAQRSFSGQVLVVGLASWLSISALIYAHLIVVQLYVAAEREMQRRMMEAFMP